MPMQAEVLEILSINRIQFKITTWVDPTSFIREATMDSCLKRRLHVVPTVITPDNSLHKLIQTTLLKEWLKAR
jgi:hypothetical protein